MGNLFSSKNDTYKTTEIKNNHKKTPIKSKKSERKPLTPKSKKEYKKQDLKINGC